LEENITHIVTHLVLQIAVILIVAKIAGELTERYLKQPSVLGELAAGVLIGPFALGALSIPGLGILFPLPHSEHGAASFIPVSNELWSVAQIASVVLLFVAGLETDLKQFLRFAPQASVIAIGGVIFPFLAGIYAPVLMGFTDSPFDPMALFLGCVMTATSVGITARILGDIQRINTPEGVTILAAAVVDDVIGILALTIVIGIVDTGSVSISNVALVGGKATGFWLVLTVGGILVAPYISQLLLKFRSNGAALALALGLALIAAALAEMFGLAMIIGAYSIGLALSGTELKERVMEPLEAVFNTLVPIFFVVMGMLVNLEAMNAAISLGIVITILAILSKLFGSGLPALAVGFNRIGSTRIGIGMLPRGEVALIIAGIGLARGVIGADIFGVAILMTVVTTFLAPILLVPSFNSGGSGLRKP
jgi:Kef-type K+ transport system membrane component KefB